LKALRARLRLKSRSEGLTLEVFFDGNRSIAAPVARPI
jgi:hypothetical protein